MKHLLSYTLIAFLLFASQSYSQEKFTVNGNQLELKTEVNGTISLLWNTINDEYRYFIQKGATITELTNTKVNGKYQEQYKQVLQDQTSDEDISVSKVKLTTKSLRNFFENYNKLKDPNFTITKQNIKLHTRLGAFIGMTNNVYSLNPKNEILPVLGFNFEIVDTYKLKRHSLLVQFKQTFKSSEYEYSSSDFSLNYHFKFIKSEKIDVFINTKIVGFSHENTPELDANSNPIIASSNSFSALFSFGLGLDYAIGNGYLTFLYDDIVSIIENSNDEFPLDFNIGYKFNL